MENLTPEQKLYVESTKTWFSTMEHLIEGDKHDIADDEYNILYHQKSLQLAKETLERNQARIEQNRVDFKKWCDDNALDATKLLDA